MEFLNENNMENNFLVSVKMLKEIQDTIRKHKDDRVKEVGDRVLIWDGSYNMDKNTLKSRYGIDDLFQNPGIVIQTNCEFIYVEQLLDDMVVNLDLLIKFETGEEIYTKSTMVKRIDNDKI
jgi:hypothetical protein